MCARGRRRERDSRHGAGSTPGNRWRCDRYPDPLCSARRSSFYRATLAVSLAFRFTDSVSSPTLAAWPFAFPMIIVLVLMQRSFWAHRYHNLF